ncbi:MAG: OmpA family protein [Endomicrobium sp.]|jgi:outer membrane protein OmpA-like peptidoglycan-associated protein|nr:OmpA family protein [Endomicrobium sp.]
MKNFLSVLSLLFLSAAAAFAFDAKVEPSASISIQNAVFSPYANISEGVVFVPAIQNADKIKVWALTVKNERGQKVREFLGRGGVPQKIVWDGLDEKGNIVSDGVYSYRFLVRFKKKIVILEKAAITIDATFPFLSMKTADDVYFVNERGGSFSKSVNLYLSAGDENALDFEKSFVKVLSFKNKEVKIFNFENKIPEFIEWDAIDDIYGNYLPKGNYTIVFTVADKAGNALSVSNEISVTQMPKEPPKPKEEVKVKQEERGLVINLSSKVLFDTGKSALKDEAEKSLNEVAQILAVYPKNKVSIEGHTDSSGNEAKNETLSLERANSVRDFFISKGIDADRMQIEGFGSLKPVADNKTEKGREQNRRVEIIVLKIEEAKPQAESLHDKSLQDESSQDESLQDDAAQNEFPQETNPAEQEEESIDENQNPAQKNDEIIESETLVKSLVSKERETQKSDLETALQE